MEKVVYNEDTIFNPPTGASYYEHIQGLRDELDRMEIERDNALALLQEVAEAETSEEVDDAVEKVKHFVDSHQYPEGMLDAE